MWDEEYNRRVGSCDLGLFGDPGTSALNDTNNGLTPEENSAIAKQLELEESAAKIGVSVERLLEMRAYTKKLKLKWPKMKGDRIQRKVQEYFKVKSK